MQSAAAWAQGLPWDSIHSAPGGPVGCITDTTGQLIYTRCTTWDSVSLKQRRLRMVITPTGSLTGNPDTVIVERNKPLKTSPFQ